MKKNKEISVVGLMSGSSLDGLDLACCRFWFENEKWHYIIEATDYIPYNNDWKSILSNAFYNAADKLEVLDIQLGIFLAEQTKRFIMKHQLRPDLVASHGHTVFHRPAEGITLQIGNGRAMTDLLALPVINDFRAMDVKKGGQGAPLVPVGDRWLFADYQVCVNIGGIANLSFEKNCKRIAYDICIANQALNHIANKLGFDFDKGGDIARNGNLSKALFDQLNQLSYYTQAYPKSLGRESFEKDFLPLINETGISSEDQLHTLIEHIALQISRAASGISKGKMLITGGGALNTFLIERIKEYSDHAIELPDEQIIAFKEAIVFAFLGVLRWNNQINCLSSVTGATEDSCTGEVWLPKPG